MTKHPISLAILACFGCLTLSVPAQAATIEELQAEITAQKKIAAAQQARLEKLEEMLQATAATAALATQKSEQAVKAVDANAKGMSKPAGVSIYGIVDAGVEIGDYGQGSKTRIQSGLGSASRLGFKGERDLGDNLNAYFQLETGISVDNGQNTGHSSNVSNPGAGTASSASPNTTGVAIFSRNTFLGLNHKTLGDIRFGRDYAPIYSITSASDPFTIGGATAFRLWSSAAASRFDNGLFYATPTWSGFQAKVAYSAGMENNSTADVGVTGGTVQSATGMGNSSTGPTNEGKGVSASFTFSDGPLFVGAGYLSFKRTGNVTAPASENINRDAYNLAVTYDLKVAKLYGQFLHGKDTQKGAAVNKSLDRNVWWLGAAVPFMGRHTARAVYSRLDDRRTTDRDSEHIGLGYEYAFDKQTDLYAYYAQVTNKNGGQNSLCAGGTCQGYDKDSGLPPDFTPTSLMFGARYRF